MLKKTGWLSLLLVVLLVGSLAGCRRGGEEADLELPDETQVEEQVNRFLEENQVTLPEGAERANLSSPEDSGETGVVTRQEQEVGEEVTVLAALPDLEQGSYYAWMVTGEDSYELIGALNPAKGGYLIERVMSGEVQSTGEVVVSRETSVGDAPTNVVLRGSF